MAVVSVALPPIPLDEAPAAMAACVGCHRSIVETYLQHGMVRSVGPIGQPPEGKVHNAATGTTYEIAHGAGGKTWLNATFADGGQRQQRLVGRIGAGIFDTSWVGEEADISDGNPTGRLFFAPVETITNHGHELSPFELAENPAGLDLALTDGCLTCHTLSRLGNLSGAARAGGIDPQRGSVSNVHVYPPNGLGEDAFEQLSGLTCDTCHGDPTRHLELMSGMGDEDLLGGTGLEPLGDLAAGLQRDICARCHLQGDARLDLVDGRVDLQSPLAGQIPVLIPAHDAESDDFRFVGQLERLVLSPCFEGTPEMTCTTCHDPHQGVQSQGVVSFDQACIGCHGGGSEAKEDDDDGSCSRPEDLSVAAVTGEASRSISGCVDCHVRRSQPYDLPHVRSADHFIRRRIPLPQGDIPHRQFADLDGEVKLYDDGRLAETLATPKGRLWLAGVRAMGLMTMGRLEESVRLFDQFPAPGTAGALRASAPEGLEPLETHPSFHQARALVLMSQGRFAESRAAYNDTLTLDPLIADARLARARLAFDTGDVAGALSDTQEVIDLYPRTEAPWNLRAQMAERLGRLDLATSAFTASIRHWPSNAIVSFKLGLLLRQEGDEEEARRAIERARLLEPSLVLPGAGPISQH